MTYWETSRIGCLLISLWRSITKIPLTLPTGRRPSGKYSKTGISGSTKRPWMLPARRAVPSIAHWQHSSTVISSTTGSCRISRPWICSRFLTERICLTPCLSISRRCSIRCTGMRCNLILWPRTAPSSSGSVRRTIPKAACPSPQKRCGLFHRYINSNYILFLLFST